MSKFSVGDRVVVVKNNHPDMGDYTGKRGEVTFVSGDAEYEVSVRVGEGRRFFDSSELEFQHVYDSLSSPGPNLVSSDEAVDHPSHYTRGKFEAIDVIEDSGVNYRLGNVLKYVLRCDHKHDDNGVQDLKKALWYLTREVEAREAKRANS